VERRETGSDEELLTASATCPDMFVDFYDRVFPGLLSYFARRTFDAQVAADLTAETLADAYASRRRYHDRGPGSACAWLYTVAARKLARYLRRMHVEDAARRRLGMERIELDSDDVERIEELIDFAHVGREVRAAFDALRGDQREALRLRVIEGCSYREVAAELGCTEETARARVSRGLRQLAAQLDG
jgi:RNA polymerase sigma-70 factor (ECF subfamily)